MPRICGPLTTIIRASTFYPMGVKTDQDGAALSYRDAGVDIDAGAALVDAIKPLAGATARPGVMGGLGGFGALFDLAETGYEDPLLVAATDGVGTKLKIAIDSGHHETVGIDLVAMCVNDLLAQGAEPLFFLDYFSSGRLETEVATAVVSGIAEGCRRAGAALIGGETAEMPGLYGSGDYDLAGFAVGAVERSKVLPHANVVPGDVLIALPSSGPHSNGYSLIRKVVEQAGLSLAAPAPFAPEMSLSEALLIPTEIYVAPILALLKRSSALKALAHITGGGLPENLPRVLPDGVSARVDLGTLSPLPVFDWLARTGPIERQEMLRTFNCGAGAVLVVGQADAQSALELLEAEGAAPKVIGVLSARDGGPPIRFDGHWELDRS